MSEYVARVFFRGEGVAYDYPVELPMDNLEETRDKLCGHFGVTTLDELEIVGVSTHYMLQEVDSDFEDVIEEMSSNDNTALLDNLNDLARFIHNVVGDGELMRDVLDTLKHYYSDDLEECVDIILKHKYTLIDGNAFADLGRWWLENYRYEDIPADWLIEYFDFDQLGYDLHQGYLTSSDVRSIELMNHEAWLWINIE